MMAHPDIQRKAQDELDSVVGEDRFPTVTDRPNLSYIDAILKETMRWHTVGLVIPRKSDEDEVIHGFLVPKSATIVVNIWYV